MAISLTTLNGAITVDATSILVVSATGAASGGFIQIDQEYLEIQDGYVAATLTIPVLRGREGSATQAHPTAAQVRIGAATDFLGPAAQSSSLTPIMAPPRLRTSYSAAGAITLPLPGSDAVAVLNGTGALAMTLANPTTDMDGCRLVIIGNGKAAHTVTYAAGLGNVGGTADVITFAAAQAQGIEVVACGGFWCGIGMNTAVAGAGATINGVGLA